MSVCGIKLCIQKRKQLKPEAKIKWKLKKEECCSEVWKELRQALGGRYALLDDWEGKAVLLRQTPKKVSSMDRGKRTRIPDAGMIKYRIPFKRWHWKKNRIVGEMMKIDRNVWRLDVQRLGLQQFIE